MPAEPARGPAPGPCGALRLVGPGIVLAATGVGAGDLVAAAVSGARFGFALVWAALVGAALKFAVSEGLARWQLASGMTLLEGWARYLARPVRWIVVGYLTVWSFVVAGALMAACGMAAHALAPGLSASTWGVAHSLVAAVLVAFGSYAHFESAVKVFVAVMFVTLIGCAESVASPFDTLAAASRGTAVPPGGARFALAVIGGVGGSVTLLSYGYWIREKGWRGTRWLPTVRLDLVVAYTLTGLFGVAVMVLAAWVLHPRGTLIEGSGGVLQMAGMLESVLGRVGRWTFLFGFWGAVTTSLLGVWQGVPYLFCDFLGSVRGLDGEARRALVSSRSTAYRLFLVWLALPPMMLLVFDRPVAVIVLYTVLGSLVMPFVAGTLLYMNSREDWVGSAGRNGALALVVLVVCLVLFALLGGVELLRFLDGVA